MNNVKDRTNNKTLMLIIGIVLTILIIGGGTLAYWSWATNEAQSTNVQFTLTQNFSCSVDGGGNITSTDAVIVPTTCTNSTHAIKRTVKTNTTIITSNLDVNMDLWIKVNSLGEGLSNSDNFKYALTTSSSSCTSGVVSFGNLKDLTTDDTKPLLSKTFESTTTGSSTTDTYYLWIWLDAAETSTDTMDQSFSLSLGGECTNTPGDINAPVLDDGMVPVYINDDGEVYTVTEDSEDWYDYENKRWANVVLVKEEGINTRSYYQSNLTNNVEVEQDDILAYYVWIPRYKYRVWSTDATKTTIPQTIDIVFESADADITMDEYMTHPAFIWEGIPFAGIWVGKFETSHSSLASSTTANNLGCTDENCANADGLIIKNNVVSLRYNNISNFFYASRSMTRDENPFGLNMAQTDSHMMKNSEWGAVAYLSHSQYGINYEVRLNNNSTYKTGCGASIENSSATSNCTLVYGSGISSYPQSTTGNITGVFDMSGGAMDYVMGNYGNKVGDSGFSSIPESKYYDSYDSTHFNGTNITNTSLCDIYMCGGHALYEVSGWYSDLNNFVYSVYPWFARGGVIGHRASAGLWLFNPGNGTSTSYSTFRSVLIAYGT